jgi:NAD(P)H-flavin reductase
MIEVIPMKSALPKPTKIAKVIEESAQVKTFVLEAAVEADPGQFIMVWLPRTDEKPFRFGCLGQTRSPSAW